MFYREKVALRISTFFIFWEIELYLINITRGTIFYIWIIKRDQIKWFEIMNYKSFFVCSESNTKPL